MHEIHTNRDDLVKVRSNRINLEKTKPDKENLDSVEINQNIEVEKSVLNFSKHLEGVAKENIDFMFCVKEQDPGAETR